MKVTFITDQTHCIKFLLSFDMLDKIVPNNPKAPGCTGMFNLDKPDCWAIADRGPDGWRIGVMEGVTVEDAARVYQSIVRDINQGVDMPIRVGAFQQPEPSMN